ncbi:MAG: response regulator [Verrucomicrobia bacterium]|jgi:DNA-binding NtrC family response regulator|nr:response regulator [Verrucomicrobiota bacterium]MBT7701180.1 response regulator [Verrucomicrobiota bacterium]
MNRSRIRILFVDDSPLVLEAIKRALMDRQDDWEIEYADSGEHALALAARTRFDVIVTDLRMPGMDGDVLIERMRALDTGICCMVLCGDPETPSAAAMARQGHIILEKPCDGPTLEAALEAAIAQIGSDPGKAEAT